MADAFETIVDEVRAWPGVETEPGRFASTRIMVGRLELGHLHGSHHADLPFPRALRDELIAAGRVEAHRFAPDSGWATRWLRSDEDVRDAVALLRMQYERATSSATRDEDLPAEEG